MSIHQLSKEEIQMSAYTTKELKAILKLHQKWLNNEVGGTRANLTK